MRMFSKDNPLRCFFAFEGYNSQGMALNRLKEHYPDFDWVCVGRSEIDKYAIQAADAVFPESKDKNYGDISKINWNEVPDFDLFTYSFPCTDVSVAGRQKGLKEGSGSSSSLLWECRKAIKEKKPQYLLMENVRALAGKMFMPDFKKWLVELSDMGYATTWKILNAKDFGVPQNRERVFAISILTNDDWFDYEFPSGFKLDKLLRDELENSADEIYYLSEDKIKGVKFIPELSNDV